MRVISIIAVLVVMLSTAVPAADEEKDPTFRVTPEIGYVVLTEPASDRADDAMGFGLTMSYRPWQYFRVELPVLISSHGDSDLPEGQSAQMTLISVTPGLAFGMKGKLRGWFFVGMGATLVNSSFEVDGARAEDDDTAFATRFRAGIDYEVREKLSAGISLGVMTAALETDQIDGSSEWETFVYYTILLRATYAF